VNTANLSYTFGMASGEIILLLLLSFLLGMLLCWLLRASGLCCRRRKPHTSGYTVAYTAPPVTPARASDDFDITQLKTLVQPALDTVEDMPAPVYQQQDIVDLDPLLLNVDPFKPIVDPPDAETAIDAVVIDLEPEPTLDLPEAKPSWTDLDPLLVSIDPHKPIIDPPDMDTELELPTMQTEIQTPTPAFDPLLASIDPHKPIIDPPDMALEMDTDMSLAMPAVTLEPIDVTPIDVTPLEIKPVEIDPLLVGIDPHKPIIDPPDMPETPSISPPASHTLNNWLHKAKESVEHLAEKATPAASDWLSKAKESVEHLSEKATPATSDWLHKAKEKVEHLTEKATPAASDWLHKAKESVEHLSEKATPATSEWLHKAKEIGTGFTSKGNTIGSETLTKSGSTLAALAASAKELTEKLANSLSIHQDDLQKLKGVGPTFASILHRAGIHTYQQLAETSPLKLRSLLIVEDEQFSQHDTSSWPQQAALAAQGEWDKLQEYQDTLPAS
jgi:predicted flap endonuclease-1-like 5' DNA nuclease/gas vesicle protein